MDNDWNVSWFCKDELGPKFQHNINLNFRNPSEIKIIDKREYIRALFQKEEKQFRGSWLKEAAIDFKIIH